MGNDLLIKVPTLIQNFYSNTKFEDIILSSSIYIKTMFIKKKHSRLSSFNPLQQYPWKHKQDLESFFLSISIYLQCRTNNFIF